jgi:hypothetical protein
MVYASQEQALNLPIREWHMLFVNGGGRIREWDNSWLDQNTSSISGGPVRTGVGDILVTS